MLKLTESEVVNFWSKVDKRGPDECWPWIARVTRNGPRASPYGCMNIRARPKCQATHIALALSGSPRPSIKHGALHSCDNSMCVNPAHLRWGTPQENAKDAIERDRNFRKLSNEAVFEIRSSDAPNADLARKFGVTTVTIALARRGKTFGWLNESICLAQREHV